MEQIEPKKKKKNFLPLRLNLLFLFVFMLFGLLIIRLGFIQIVNGEYFRTQTELTKTMEASVQTERGKMFDRHGRLLVGNEPSFALSYIRVQGTTAEDHIRYAENISKYIDMPTDDITESDLKDYWIAKRDIKTLITNKLSEKEIDDLENDEQYALLKKRISEEDLKSITSDDHAMEVVAIKRELDQASNLNIAYIKKGLSKKEVAQIGEHLGELEGRFSIASASDRVYPNGRAFFYGSMGSIPAEELNHYLLRGYAQNNEVGTSYLERKYQGLLSGREKTFTFTTNKSLQPIGNPEVSPGSRGYDLVLSVDIELQKKIGEILEREILESRSAGEGPVTSAYAVMMDPHTGEVFAMVGRKLEDGEFKDDSYATLQKAFEVGSTVKGATVLAIYQMNNGHAPTINDMTIQLRGAPDFSSYTSGIGTVNDLHAIEQSSNVYMGMAVGQIAGFHFANVGGAYQARVFDNQRYRSTFQGLRDVYAQVGLGVKTGIDLPEEALGYEGPVPDNPGKLLYYTIGQYDTYTPIQMAQYVSTIANGGYRIQPHLLKEVRYSTGTSDELGPLISQFETQVFNHIDNTSSELDRVQKGFYMVTHGTRGTAANGRDGLRDTKIAGKTGTAQIDGPGLYNLTFVGYAPYDDPEVAFSVIVPHMNSGHVNVEIADAIMQAYKDSKSPGSTTTEKKEKDESDS